MRFGQYLRDGGVAKQWGSMTSLQRRDYILNNLLNRGYNIVQASAIVGNLQRENDTFGTTRRNLEGSGAQGIAQWHKSRLTELKKNYKEWYDIDNQLDFLDKEIRTNHKGAWGNNTSLKDKFMTTSDVNEATILFRKGFERPGEAEARDDIRIKNALEVMNGSSGKQTPQSSQQIVNNYYGYDPTQTPYRSINVDTKGMETNLTNWDSINNAYKKDPAMMKDLFSDVNVGKQIEETSRLEAERLKQEEKKAVIEATNKQIEDALKAKYKDQQRMLSMVPVSGVINYSN